VNGLERVLAAVEFRPVDRVPAVPQVFGHAAATAGVALENYLRNGRVLAECQLNALERYGYDAVFAFADSCVEAEALGCEIVYSRDRYPTVRLPVLRRDGTGPRLAVPDPETAGRMPHVLEAVRLLRAAVGGEVLVAGSVLGPFTLVAQLLGMESALMLAVDDMLRLEELLDVATDVLVRFGRAQLAAGADLVLTFDPASSPAVVPSRFFRELLAPRLTRLFAEFGEAGSAANWLHIAGPVQKILPYYSPAGVQLANFDYCVSAEEVAAALPGICVDGNIRSLAFVEAAPDEIRAEAKRLVEEFGERGGFVLSSGCEIPLEAQAENVAALVETARTAGAGGAAGTVAGLAGRGARPVEADSAPEGSEP
jgi:uroporphyrinogen decarboxylase